MADTPLHRQPRGRAVLLATLALAVLVALLTNGEPPDLDPPPDGSGVSQPWGFRDPLGPWGYRAALSDAAVILGVIGAVLGGLWLEARRRGERLRAIWALQPNHGVQSTFQALILAYWAIYWPDLLLQLPLLVVLLVGAYAMDAALAFALFGTWRVTVGPVPIVLSTILFFIFQGPNFRVFFLIFLIAMVSRHYVKWGDRHVFNPSALGMSVVSATYAMGVAWPWLLDKQLVQPFPVFHAFALPPNMLELLLILGLMSQARFTYVLVTLGAYAGFALPLADAQPLSLFEPAMFIAILFLITDPRTTPGSASGKLLFGVGYAVAVRAIDPLLTAFAGYDGDAKILAVPVINLLVPWLDRLGATLDRALGWLTSPRLNTVHMALWAFLATLHLRAAHEKAWRFEVIEGSAPRSFFNPWVVLDEEGRQTCEANPAWCAPFSFTEEVRMWAARPRRPYQRQFLQQDPPTPTPPTPIAGP